MSATIESAASGGARKEPPEKTGGQFFTINEHRVFVPSIAGLKVDHGGAGPGAYDCLQYGGHEICTIEQTETQPEYRGAFIVINDDGDLIEFKTIAAAVAHIDTLRAMAAAQYPDTAAGARAALMAMGGREVRAAFGPDARYQPDSSIRGVWRAIAENGRTCIVYLSGYPDALGNVRCSNDFTTDLGA